VPTAQISLIREQTVAIRPPRALWVPFMLGRPFGAVADAAFQTRVLLALLGLFRHDSGPVLEDYAEEAPAAADDGGGLACAVSFPAPAASGHALVEALRDEVRQLAVWHELAVRRRGRSTVGVFSASLDDALRHIASYVEGRPEAPPAPAMTRGLAIKRACDDLRAYYYEAAAAQPGSPSPQALDRWFWNDTAAARALLAIREYCLASDDDSLRPLARLGLIPRAVLERLGS
jgi:hypothetical protein